MLIEVMARILLVILIATIIYAALWLFPKKIKLQRKYGLQKNNDDLIKLAKQENEDVRKLRRTSLLVLRIAISSGLLLVVLNHFSRR